MMNGDFYQFFARGLFLLYKAPKFRLNKIP